jgi:hypothetical protein
MLSLSEAGEAGHVAHKGSWENAYKIQLVKPETRPLVRPRNRWLILKGF